MGHATLTQFQSHCVLKYQSIDNSIVIRIDRGLQLLAMLISANFRQLILFVFVVGKEPGSTLEMFDR